MNVPPKRIHILGLGSIGAITAHLLSESPLNLDITLILHRASLFQDYVSQGRHIVVRYNDDRAEQSTSHRIEYPLDNGEWVEPPESPPPGEGGQTVSRNNEFIHNLILCCKTIQTVAALEPLRHRLGPGSTIAFLQNGCGMIDEVNEKIFTDPARRPRYVAGVVYHAGSLNAPFDVKYTASKALLLGIAPRSTSTDSREAALLHDGAAVSTGVSEEPCFLVDALSSATRLKTEVYPYVEILQRQLEKLAINAFTNAVSAKEDADNAYLLMVPAQYRIAVSKEISAVYLKLPEFRDVGDVTERFGWETLDANVCEHMNKFNTGITSICWDLRNGRKTEIGYINGYISKRGREVGQETPLIDALVHSVEQRGG